MAAISYFSEGLDFSIPHPRKTASWIKTVAEKERKKIKSVNYIFCSDDYLHTINVDYLNHDTLTDIITFDNSDKEAAGLEGDIFISVERVRENAQRLNIDFKDELHRVMIHGILHLAGYHDITPTQESQMRGKEDTYLSLRSF